MKPILIMNPSSRSGRGQRLWPIWESGLRAAGISYEKVVTQAAYDAFQTAKSAAGEHSLVAVGGDGTINEVLDGMMQSDARHLSLGVLYAGTSPDFCLFHHIPTEPRQALDCLLRHHTRPVDVARILYHRADGTTPTGHFASSCNLGLGARVASFANRHRAWLGDRLGTGLGVLLAMVSSRPFDLEITLDGDAVSLRRVNHLAIMKNPYIASGIQLNLPLRPHDGHLAVVAIQGLDRMRLPRLLPMLYSGRLAESPHVRRFTAASVTVRSDRDLPLEYDGDPHGMLPATVTILPGSLSLVVPSPRTRPHPSEAPLHALTHDANTVAAQRRTRT